MTYVLDIARVGKRHTIFIRMSEEEAPGVYVLTLPDGTTRDYSEGYSGKAVATYENGDQYEGDFKDGSRHGEGVYTFKNGQTYTGA